MSTLCRFLLSALAFAPTVGAAQGPRLGVPSTLETNVQIASQPVNLGVFGLPLSSVRTLVDKVNAVTMSDVRCVARQYVPIEKLTLVVVGDLAKIRPGIEGLHLGPISVLDVSSIAR
jgi:hypothetical protein